MAITIAEDVNDRNSHSLLVETQSGTVTLGHSGTVSCTTKCGFQYNPAITHWSLIILFGKLCLHKNLPVNIYDSFFCNHQILEAIQLAFNRWVDKQPLVHLYNGTIFRDEKEGTIKLCQYMDNLDCILQLWKKPVCKGYLL